jgi:hypothetical protein
VSLWLSDAEVAEVDAFINSADNLQWEREVASSWRTGPTSYELHQQRQRERETAMRNSASARRRAAKMRRTPPWVDHLAIAAVYAQARAMTANTGESHHVDHFYPLQGRLVSGLHVAENLQILRGVENMRKNNRYEP